jgi:hypothetical protein
MAAMARPAPVLPLVPSMMVPPGLRRPFASASSIIARPMRSLTEPPGLKNSTFARTVHGTSAGIRLSFTNGVLPMLPRMLSCHIVCLESRDVRGWNREGMGSKGRGRRKNIRSRTTGFATT